jgi:small subunit ribosomal protein S6
VTEVTEVAENNAALEAEETAVVQTEAATEENQVDPQAGQESDVPEMSASAGETTGGETTGGEESASEAMPAASAPTPDAEGFTSALPSISSTDETRKHVVGGVGYEIIYVVKAGDPQLVETSSQRVRELIEKTDGAVDNVRASEVRRFAYPIKKQNEGVYVVVNARFKPEFTGELDRYFKIDESILRHMMLKEDR